MTKKSLKHGGDGEGNNFILPNPEWGDFVLPSLAHKGICEGTQIACKTKT
jgi:hypothetical protein